MPVTRGIGGMANQATRLADTWGVVTIDLVARLWVGLIFLASGISRVERWGAQNAAFSAENGSPVPLIPDGRITQFLGIDANALVLPPEIIKYLVTGGELIFPVLLILGLFTRLSAVVVFFMAAVIQFWVGSIKEVYFQEIHYFWMLTALVPAVLRPNALRLEFWLNERQTLLMTGLVLLLVALWVIYSAL